MDETRSLRKRNFLKLTGTVLNTLGNVQSTIFTFQKGAGAPGREPVVNEQEQKQMMAYMYKKQEEYKVCIDLDLAV
jgi:hypothetical protein